MTFCFNSAASSALEQPRHRFSRDRLPGEGQQRWRKSGRGSRRQARSIGKFNLIFNFHCTESLVVAHQLSFTDVVEVFQELRSIDTQEHEATEALYRDGCSCSCSLGPGRTPCCRLLSVSYYREMRCSSLEMTKDQRDCVMKGQIMAMTSTSELTRHSTTVTPENRQRERSCYVHQRLTICRSTFLFLHAVGKSTFKALRRSCREDGLVPRVHGNARRLPSDSFTYESIKYVVSFIENYAEDHTILLPGRIPGYKRSDLQLLPCSTTKRSVWNIYCSATTTVSIHCVTYTTFSRIWRSLLPHILPARPMTDLCAVCHHNAGLIMRSSNLSEEGKSEVILHTH